MKASIPESWWNISRNLARCDNLNQVQMPKSNTFEEKYPYISSLVEQYGWI
ncbi:hypothetical protein [Nostoc sp.]|uniref:hypothetical protein n=1 Tax=Nostoc sp. TaxID=1180 RepID=UPI002FFC350E